MGGWLIAIHRDNHLLDKRSQEFLSIPRRRCRRVPYRGKVGPNGKEAVPFLLAEEAGPLLEAAGEIFIRPVQIGLALLPFAFEPTGDKSVVWVDGSIAPLRALGLIVCPLCGLPPMLERRLVIGLKSLGGGERGRQFSRLERSEKRLGERLVNLHAANGETVASTALDDDLTGAVVAGGGVAPAIMSLQAPATVSACAQALQKRRPLSHGAARLVRPWARVAGQPDLVGFKGSPVNVALMVLLDQHLPFRLRQVSHAFLGRASAVELCLPPRPPISVSARVGGVAQNLMDRVVAGVDL